MATLTQPQQEQRPLTGYDLKRDLLASLLAGQAAGLFMALAVMIVFPLFVGRPAYFPVQVIGSGAFGEVALQGGFHPPAFIAGIFIHQLVALIWSIPFALLINRIEHTWVNVLAVGLAVAVMSQVLDNTFVVPALYRAIHGSNIWAQNIPMGWSWIAHLVYGASFLLFLPIRDRVANNDPLVR